MLTRQLLVKCIRPGATALSTSASNAGPRVAVVLAGSGVYDGSEVHEASAVLAGITRVGATPVCHAPDKPQMHTIDHTKGEPIEGDNRNVLKEAARISRGNILPLSDLTADKADAVIFPGGFGAAKNLSDFAVNGPNCTVDPDVERVIKAFHGAKKPIGLCCIAPVLAAKVLGDVTITMGESGRSAGAIEAAKAMGANHVEKDVTEVAIDENNLVVTTPAFMCGTDKFHLIHDGVAEMVKAVVNLVKK